jgi:hypothetical protein
MCLELDTNALRKRMRPLPVRLYLSYRGWRAFGLSRIDALRGAWRISRLVAKIR